MLTTAPINYAQSRAALVQAICAATGLATGQVVRAQAQGPVQPPPTRPYCTFTYRVAAMRTGFRDGFAYAPDLGPTMWRCRGNRAIAVDLNFFADDQDTAYSLAATMQAGLFMPAARDCLAAAGAAVWQVGDVTDVTALLGTGFEARALLEFQMGLAFDVPVDLGTIEQVDVHGLVYDETGNVSLDFTVLSTTEGT